MMSSHKREGAETRSPKSPHSKFSNQIKGLLNDMQETERCVSDVVDCVQNADSSRDAMQAPRGPRPLTHVSTQNLRFTVPIRDSPQKASRHERRSTPVSS